MLVITKKIFLSILLTGLVILTACKKEIIQKDEMQSESAFFAMDTYMSVTAYGENAQSAVNQAEDRVAELEKLWAVTDENSEIYLIDHNNGESVDISRETADLIGFSLDISEITDGALDCTIYPLLTAWGFTTGEYQIPDEKQLNVLLENIGYEKVLIEEQNITIPENMQLDLGAVGKGYTGDIIAEILKENGITSALLDLGGNIQTIGRKPNGSEWKVGLRSPFDNNSFATLEVSDCAVITSGGYERYFIGEDGKTYWHILDPKTGRPANSGLLSVTVVGKEGKLCDALSTALFVMGLDKAKEFWRNRDNFEMVLITDDAKIYITDGLEDAFLLNKMYENQQVEVLYR